MRLPPGSDLRRRLVKFAAVRGWEATARGDTPAALLTVDPNYELNLFGAGARALGFSEQYRGHAGMIEFMDSWRTAWSSIEYALEHILDLGDRIVMRLRTTSRGAASGAEVSATAGVVYFVPDGTVIRQDFYWDWAECAAALGLEQLAARSSDIKLRTG
jgi:ketosteroid isomerase-like protein